uniref:Transmembrane protein 65 n=1 Tax=Caenorhabditis japonica TaxID=281687 RepID=A0A8R1HRF5_CAEJA
MPDGITIDFAAEVAKQCAEIRDLYEIEECVRPPSEQNWIEFLYDLSAFLLELGCPHEQLTCGEITSRLEHQSNRDLLSAFLDSEVKTARLVTLQKIESGEMFSDKRDLELTNVLDSALKTLNVPKQAGTSNEWKLLESLRQKADGRVGQSCRNPLFKATLDDKTLPEIEKQCEMFSRDFYNRLLLLNSRLKVTVESFLWNARLKSHKTEIQSILAKRVEAIGKVRAETDVAHLLAASSSLLYIQKASAMERSSPARMAFATIGRASTRMLLGGGPPKYVRCSTTAAFKHLDKLIIETPDDAMEIASRLTITEQQFLKTALEECMLKREKGKVADLTPEQVKGVFLVNSIPFIGFGVLDNMIMILAGEYIDQQLGTVLAISTMAAAALGNLISDIAGVGLAHYVEVAVQRVGIKHPVLSAEQLESGKARFTTNAARAAGLTIGCLIGMFPLLFFDDDDDVDEKKKKKKKNQEE